MRVDTMHVRFCEKLARRNGWIEVEDAMPWAEGPGIVHGPTWRGEERANDSVYEPGAWVYLCEEVGLLP